MFRTWPQIDLVVIWSLWSFILKSYISHTLDNYVPEVIRGTDENVDEFLQTRENYLLLKGYILFAALSTKEIEYMFAIPNKSPKMSQRAGTGSQNI